MRRSSGERGGWPRRFSTRRQIAGDVQRDLLLRRLARHADSQFGRDHFFGEIRTPADFRKRVPIGGYDRHEPYIDRVRQGDTNALFGDGTEVLMFAMTSGTTNRPKTIPVTPRLSRRLPRGLDDLGNPGVRRPSRDDQRWSAADPASRQRLA